MSYDPEDHHVPFARMAGPLVLWACVLLALTAMGRPGSSAPAAPLVVAAPCGPADPGALVPSPPRERGAIAEVHAS
jgi:hypothetical protein